MPARRKDNDEAYVIDLCDDALGLVASRQHRFPFLRGDSKGARPGIALPVDAYYADLSLVVEFRERQHDVAVKFFDKPDRMTASGVDRGEQRRLYDQRRREVLPRHGIELVEISLADLANDGRGGLLRRRADDTKTLSRVLAKWTR